MDSQLNAQPSHSPFFRPGYNDFGFAFLCRRSLPVSLFSPDLGSPISLSNDKSCLSSQNSVLDFTNEQLPAFYPAPWLDLEIDSVFMSSTLFDRTSLTIRNKREPRIWFDRNKNPQIVRKNVCPSCSDTIFVVTVVHR